MVLVYVVFEMLDIVGVARSFVYRIWGILVLWGGKMVIPVSFCTREERRFQ